MVKSKVKSKQLKMKQIISGQFISQDGSGSYCVIGLSEEGKVYRYDANCRGWIEWNMTISSCGRHNR